MKGMAAQIAPPGAAAEESEERAGFHDSSEVSKATEKCNCCIPSCKPPGAEGRLGRQSASWVPAPAFTHTRHGVT